MNSDLEFQNGIVEFDFVQEKDTLPKTTIADLRIIIL